MKKSLVILMMAMMAVSVFAMDLPKQGFGVQIGWAQPVIRLNSPTSKDTLVNTVKLNGFKVGVMYDASYIAGFGSTIGVNYTFGMSRGGWDKERPSQLTPLPQTRNTITYHQIEVYVDWQYKFEVAKETYLMLYTGPTLQCGLGFEMRVDRKELNPYTLEEEIIYGERHNAYKSTDNDNALRRFNVTWGVGAGFQYKRYFIRGGYDFGLLTPYKNADFTNGNHARGRLDQWEIKLGLYLWYNE